MWAGEKLASVPPESALPAEDPWFSAEYTVDHHTTPWIPYVSLSYLQLNRYIYMV